MSDAETLERGDLIAIPTNTIALFTDGKQFSEFYERIKRETDAFTPDLSSDKGRKAIASMAFKVTKTKTALDAAGKTLTEDARKQIDQVNAARRVMREQLEDLATEVRRPLTIWEEQEAARIARCEDAIKQLRAHATVSIEETAADVRERRAAVAGAQIEASEFGEFHDMATSLKASALGALDAAIVRLTKEEADRAELERLRGETLKRDLFDRMKEHIDQCRQLKIGGETYPFPIIIRELEERVQLDADGVGDLWPKLDSLRSEALADVKAQFEAHMEAGRREEQERADRQAAEAADAERQRMAQAAETARLQALRDAEEKAAREMAEREAATAEERRRLQEAHDLELAEAQRQRDEAIADQRRQDEERRRLDQAAADMAEQRRREEEARTKDRAHRSKVMGSAKEALMASCDLTEPVAKQIVLSICAGDIPAVTLAF